MQTAPRAGDSSCWTTSPRATRCVLAHSIIYKGYFVPCAPHTTVQVSETCPLHLPTRPAGCCTRGKCPQHKLQAASLSPHCTRHKYSCGIVCMSSIAMFIWMCTKYKNRWQLQGQRDSMQSLGVQQTCAPHKPNKPTWAAVHSQASHGQCNALKF